MSLRLCRQPMRCLLRNKHAVDNHVGLGCEIVSIANKAQNALISHFDPKSPVVEAFRTLRTNLQYIKAGESLRKLLITSPGPGEGKSTIVANLGYLLAQSGKKVIVVSADLRKPTVHKILQMPNRQGLTNILAGMASLDECLMPVPLIENLHFIASGPTPPNPAELLGSEQMSELINELERRADIVVFDAPPVVAGVYSGSTADFIFKIDEKGNKSVFANNLAHPLQLTIDSQGKIYSINYAATPILTIISPSGEVLETYDSAELGLQTPGAGIAVTKDGKKLYILDQQDISVRIYNWVD
jgi:capsular exopolysaccharide synthesis family protein